MKSVSWEFTVDWRKLRLLDELDRRGTITATAEALHLTPSAVSQQMAGLSRDIGVPLLEKRGRTVVLTGQARLLLSHAQDMRELAERTRTALDAWSDGTAGYVRIASLTTGITSLVAPAFTRLREERPGLTLRVINREPRDALDLLDGGEAEIIVTVDYPDAPSRQDARYRRIDLIDDIMDAVLPADHPFADQESIDLADLATERWVGPASSDPCGYIVNGICATSGFTPDVRHDTQEWEAVAALVAAGAGVALVPRSAQPLRPTGLAVLSVTGAPATRPLFALLRAGTEADPAIATVLDALRTAAAEHSRAGSGAPGVLRRVVRPL
jgi:DNA-binding transcriptional LysR family regulator